jgi:hypothetical protein
MPRLVVCFVLIVSQFAHAFGGDDPLQSQPLEPMPMPLG